MLNCSSSFLARRLLPSMSYQTRSFFGKKKKKSKPKLTVDHRNPMTCAESPYSPRVPRPCFDLSTVLVEQGGKAHEKLIRSFLFTHYWPREPSAVSLYMPVCSPYVHFRTEKYARTGDRWLAYEVLARTNECRLVGVLVADKTYPWMVDELEEWENYTGSKAEKHSMYFNAHCLRAPDLFNVYHVPYIYNIEVLATSTDVTGLGVASLLLRSALVRAIEARHPLVHMISTNEYTHDVCKKAGMHLAWQMNYDELLDRRGKCVFYPRRPHLKVCIFVRQFSEREGQIPDSCKSASLYDIYRREIVDKKYPEPKPKKICDPKFPLLPEVKNCKC